MESNTASPIAESSAEESTLVSPSHYAPESEIRVSMSSAEPKRDTLLDPPRTSVGARIFTFLGLLRSALIWPFAAALRALSWALSRPPLTGALPAPPPWPGKGAALSSDQLGEAILYRLFGLSPRYLRGIAEIANFLVDVQACPKSERLRTHVHFIASRYDARIKEPVPVAWIRELLPYELRSEVTRALNELADKRKIEILPLKTKDEWILKGAICNQGGSLLTHVRVLRRL